MAMGTGWCVSERRIGLRRAVGLRVTLRSFAWRVGGPEENGNAVNPDRHTLRLICLAVVAVASCVFAVQASIASDPERLACLDAIANKKGHAAPTEMTRDERSLIIARCLSQTGEFSSAMARACVEQDLASYVAVLAYPQECAPFVVRCAKQLGQHGWGMVKICVDEDIEAERALAD